jgi:hypothetical protein
LLVAEIAQTQTNKLAAQKNDTNEPFTFAAAATVLGARCNCSAILGKSERPINTGTRQGTRRAHKLNSSKRRLIILSIFGGDDCKRFFLCDNCASEAPKTQ